MGAALNLTCGWRRVARSVDTYGKVSREPSWRSGRFARLAHPATEAATLAADFRRGALQTREGLTESMTGCYGEDGEVFICPQMQV
jgi:hypothetical protein